MCPLALARHATAHRTEFFMAGGWPRPLRDATMKGGPQRKEYPMPLLLLVLLALFGVGYYNRELASPPVAVRVEPATMAPDHSAWARACEARLTEAAREFEAAAGFTCTPGTVTITTLPSGVDYVEYTRAVDEGIYQVAITEEPDDEGVTP